MFCRHCLTEKPADPSTKAWCMDCRNQAAKEARAFKRAHPPRLYSGKTYDSRNLILRELGFQSYKEYLLSPLWKSIRQKVFKTKGCSCFLCGRQATEIHHNRYHKNDLLGLHLHFISPICDECHKAIEFSPRGRKLKLAESRRLFTRKRKLNRGRSL